MRGDSVVERYLRILAEATGLGSVIFTLLALRSIVDEAPYLLAVIYIPLTILFCALPVFLGFLGLRGSVAAIRGVATAQAVVAALFLALWGPATLATPLAGDRGPWLLGSLAVGAAAAVIAWPPRLVWPYVAALSLGAGVLRYVTIGSTELVLPVQDIVSVGCLSFFIAGLLMVTLRAGRAQDAALAIAVADARTAAEVESRARQRARFGSFVHDDVITTLLAAAHATRHTPLTGDRDQCETCSRPARSVRRCEIVRGPSRGGVRGGTPVGGQRDSRRCGVRRVARGLHRADSRVRGPCNDGGARGSDAQQRAARRLTVGNREASSHHDCHGEIDCYRGP